MANNTDIFSWMNSKMSDYRSLKHSCYTYFVCLFSFPGFCCERRRLHYNISKPNIVWKTEMGKMLSRPIHSRKIGVQNPSNLYHQVLNEDFTRILAWGTKAPLQHSVKNPCNSVARLTCTYFMQAHARTMDITLHWEKKILSKSLKILVVNIFGDPCNIFGIGYSLQCRRISGAWALKNPSVLPSWIRKLKRVGASQKQP